MQLSKQFTIDRITHIIENRLNSFLKKDNEELPTKTIEAELKHMLESFKVMNMIRGFHYEINLPQIILKLIIGTEIEYTHIQFVLHQHQIKIFMGDVCDVI